MGTKRKLNRNPPTRLNKRLSLVFKQHSVIHVLSLISGWFCGRFKKHRAEYISQRWLISIVIRPNLEINSPSPIIIQRITNYHQSIPSNQVTDLSWYPKLQKSMKNWSLYLPLMTVQSITVCDVTGLSLNAKPRFIVNIQYKEISREAD